MVKGTVHRFYMSGPRNRIQPRNIGHFKRLFFIHVSFSNGNAPLHHEIERSGHMDRFKKNRIPELETVLLPTPPPERNSLNSPFKLPR